MLLSIPRHRVSSVLGFLWPDKPLCPPTQQRLPSPMGCWIGITQDARFTKYADYTTIDGARRCCRLSRYVDLVRSQQLS